MSAKSAKVESVAKALTIKDRFALVGILPKQGDIITMMMVRDLELKMVMSETEKKKHNFRKREGGAGWQWDLPDKRKTIELSNTEMELILAQITVLDSQKKVSADLLDLCILMRK